MTQRLQAPNAMATQTLVRRFEPVEPDAPVVFDSPHSGTFYPADFRAAVPLHLLQGGEDRFVDELIADAPQHGAVLVVACFARTYIDPNRTLLDLDDGLIAGTWPGPTKPSDNTKRGVGLIFRHVGESVPIYDRLLSVEEVQHRIDGYWRPYHDTLGAALNERHQRWGAVWHVNCHSMTGMGNELSPDPGRPRPNIVLGDRDGTTCAPEFTDFVASAIKQLGYSVGINNPYKGAELVLRNGKPMERRHSLQIEINRNLYMDPQSLEKTSNFQYLRADLARLARHICRYARDAAAK